MNVNDRKFTFADLITFVSALAFGFLMYLSYNFATLGNNLESITYALIMALVLFLLAFGAKFLKRSNGNFKTSIIVEYVFLGFYLFAAFIFFEGTRFSHFFSVTDNKQEIVSTMNTNLENTKQMFNSYDYYKNTRVVRYKTLLSEVCESQDIDIEKYKEFGFDSLVDCNEQVERGKDLLNAKINQNLYDEQWFNDATRAINNWKPITVVNYVNDISSKTDNWYNSLVELSMYRAKGEVGAEDFSYTLSINDSKELFKKDYGHTALSRIIALLLYVLMITSYFISSRSSKSPYNYWGAKKAKRISLEGKHNVEL